MHFATVPLKCLNRSLINTSKIRGETRELRLQNKQGHGTFFNLEEWQMDCLNTLIQPKLCLLRRFGYFFKPLSILFKSIKD